MPQHIGIDSGHPSITFTEQDLAVFSEASGDRNPLHLNPEYARRTSYGQPVVFGSLGAIACLGHIRLPAGWAATSLEANFPRPMFLGVTYRVETSKTEGRWEVRLFDGSVLVVSLIVKAENSNAAETPKWVDAPAFERCEAVLRKQESIVAGLSVSGLYGCNTVALAKLMAQWGVLDPFLAAALCWGSYLVGMEVPGESALFSKLVLRLLGSVGGLHPMAYRASVKSVDSRYGLVNTEVSLLSGTSVVAAGECWSYIRPAVPEVEEMEATGVNPNSLSGRVAVILGSSRGLGAAMKRALDMRGAIVFGMARSGNAGDPSRIEVGDAANRHALQRLQERVYREHGRLDFLICNACPPVLPLRLEPNAAERIGAYVHHALSLTLTPLCYFLGLLNESNGCAVIISSTFVEHPVREFPHYIAAKGAVEALLRVASLQYPRVRTLIVRPPKLLTAMTNTPLGRLGAASPQVFANRIASRLEGPLEPGKTEILTFPKE